MDFFMDNPIQWFRKRKRLRQIWWEFVSIVQTDTHINLYKYKQIVFLGYGVFKMNFQSVQRVDACHEAYANRL